MDEAVSKHKRRGCRPALDLLDMNDAPKDGKPIWLYQDEETREQATWRNTRYFDAVSRVWRNTGFWVKRNAGGSRIPFTPIGWKAIEMWCE
jgi:hypothetical protein